MLQQIYVHSFSKDPDTAVWVFWYFEKKTADGKLFPMGYKPQDHATVANIKYEKPVLTKRGGKTVEIKKFWHPTPDAWSPVYRDMLRPFHFGKYTTPRLPVDLGPCDMDLIRQCPRVLRTPIKPEGEMEMRLPKELVPVLPIVQRLMQFEYHVNDNLRDFHVHLTLDHSEVKAGTTQRFPGWHGDGLQGGQFKEKRVCEHSYIVGSNPSVEVCMQPFFVEHVNEDRYNLFKEFDRQARETNVFQTRPEHIYLMDPYVVHRTPLIRETTYRTFLRLTVANADLPIEANTYNPMWGGQEYDDKLDIRDFVLPPDTDIHWHHYGLEGDN